MNKKYILCMVVLFFIFCFTSIGFAEKKTIKVESGLVGWWKFDEGEGDILHDSSGKNNHGKIHGATWVKGKTGSVLFFDGKSHVNCGNDASLQIEGPLTVSAWINLLPISANGRHDFAVSKSTWNLGIEIRESIEYVNFMCLNAESDYNNWLWLGNNLNRMKKVPLDKWAYIAVVYNVEYEDVDVYLDGELVGREKKFDGAIGNFDKYYLMFGGESPFYPDSYTKRHPFYGLIGETKIYNRALSDEEIKTNYESESNTKGNESASQLAPADKMSH